MKLLTWTGAALVVAFGIGIFAEVWILAVAALVVFVLMMIIEDHHYPPHEPRGWYRD